MVFHYHRMEGMYVVDKEIFYTKLYSAILLLLILLLMLLPFFAPTSVKLNIAERIFVLHNKKYRNFCILRHTHTQTSIYEMEAKSSDSNNRKKTAKLQYRQQQQQQWQKQQKIIVFMHHEASIIAV